MKYSEDVNIGARLRFSGRVSGTSCVRTRLWGLVALALCLCGGSRTIRATGCFSFWPCYAHDVTRASTAEEIVVLGSYRCGRHYRWCSWCGLCKGWVDMYVSTCQAEDALVTACGLFASRTRTFFATSNRSGCVSSYFCMHKHVTCAHSGRMDEMISVILRRKKRLAATNKSAGERRGL